MAATSHGYLLQISARTLGELTLANFCERCFWIKLHHRDRMPYSIPMPGIFSSIDSYSKKVIHAHFEQHGRLPLWYPAVGPVVAIIRAPHWSRFRYVDPATQICLTGVPDELLELADGSSCIVDYKTARLSDSFRRSRRSGLCTRSR